MKNRILIIGMVLVVIGLMLVTTSITFGQSSNEFVIPLTDPAKRGRLKAHINSGSITVKGTARKDVLVRYKSEADDHGDHDENQQNREGLKRIAGGGLDLEAAENNNFVSVQSNSWSNEINLEIEVPSGFDVEAHTYNDGDLIMTNLQGELALTNYNGEITALNISGSVIATTYNGEIRVTFDNVAADTPMSYTTYNGDIDVTFPQSTKATFKMKTEQGEIYTGFDMTITSPGPKQTKDARSGAFKIVIDEWKKGDVNGGGPEITMKNYNGDIYIRKK